MKLKLKKFHIGSFFYNNKFVMVFSLLLSIIIWLKVSTSETQKIEKKISNIPITVNLSNNAVENGLEVFGTKDVTAEVAVNGNRIILGQLTNKDVQVFAPQSANIINTVGNYTLQLAARPIGILNDYEIEPTVSPGYINIFADRKKTQEFVITPQISYNTTSKYYESPVVLSESNISITGPESLISSIGKVVVEQAIQDNLDKTVTINDLPINIYDKSGNLVVSPYLTLSTSKVSVTVHVLRKKTLTVLPSFSSKPEGFEITSSMISITPSTIELAGSEDILNSIKNLTLDPLDFSLISPRKNSFSLPLKIPEGTTNISNVNTCNLKLNLNGISDKKIEVSRFILENIPSGKKATCSTKSLTVDVVGPSSTIKDLNSKSVVAKIDLSGKENFTGTRQMPAKIVFENAPGLWAYGQYNVNVHVS